MSLRLRKPDLDVMVDLEIYAEQNLRQGAGYALVDEDTKQVIATCGIMPYWAGMAEIWLLCDRDVERYGHALLHACRWLVARHQTADQLWRMQAHCQAEWEEANNFMRHLGFHIETRLPYFGVNHVDYNLWALLKRWD